MANEMSDSESVKPWTVRGIPPEERNAAIAAAKRSDMTLGDWLSRAIRTEIQQEKQANRAPVAVGQAVSDSQTSLSNAERVAASIRDLAAAGVPVAKSHASKITAALVAHLAAPVRRRKGVGQTGEAEVSDKIE